MRSRTVSVFRPRKSNLTRPALLDVLHVKLRDGDVRSRVAIERDQFLQWPVADDHACGVGAGMAVEAFEPERRVDQAVDPGLGARLAQQSLLVERLLQGDGVRGIDRHQLGEAVDHVKGHLQDAPDIAHDSAGLERAEGNDLGNPILAVAILHIGDHVVATVLAEVDIDVGHRNAFRIEEPFEQEPETQRVEIGDRQRPCDHGTGTRAAPGTHRNVLPSGPLDEIRHDQEVAGESHLDDDAEFILQALAIGRAGPCAFRIVHALREDMAREPGLEPVGGLAAKFVGLAGSPCRCIGRQDRPALRRGGGAAPGDGHRVGDGFGQIGKKLRHLAGGLETMFGGHAPADGNVHGCAFGDAHQGVVRLVHVPVGEHHVVGGDQGKVQPVGEVKHRGLAAELFGHAVALELDIESPGKQFGQCLENVQRFPVAALQNAPADGTERPAGQAQKAVRMAFQIGEAKRGNFAGPRREKGAAGQAHKVGVARRVLGQKDHAFGKALVACRLVRRDAQRGKRADDRLYAVAGAGDGEIQDAEHVAAVGHRHRRHSAVRAQPHQIGNLDGALEERERGVDPQVNEAWFSRHASGFHSCAEGSRPRPARLWRFPGRFCRNAPDNPVDCLWTRRKCRRCGG